MKFSEVAKRVIELATTIREYWEAELPKYHPKYPLVQPGAGDPPSPPQEGELRQFLLSRPADEVYKLLALMYLGRGDFNALGIVEMAKELRKSFSTDGAIRQMIAKGPLADYLRDGLDELTTSGLDIDNLETALATGS
ncbi:MAG: DUF3775 domain-containing protein [Planctomycetes bacterium]|nr:DUF3775 domain-containing protein [Planctomycetota bacterium]